MAEENGNRVLELRSLTVTTYALRFERKGLVFEPGQHITLGAYGSPEVREYSIYSRPQDDFLEVLVKETDPGLVSRRLRRCQAGERVQVNGPFGFFTLPEERSGSFWAIATGTGIAPFHSMTGAYPELDMQVLHGVREGKDAYEREHYPRYIACTSRTEDGDFHGRVTDYLERVDVDPSSHVYLCGNCEMIYAVYDLLTSRGFPAGQIKTEVYF